eukprot:364516-Chlamydomonas_euryale.AAC.21
MGREHGTRTKMMGREHGTRTKMMGREHGTVTKDDGARVWHKDKEDEEIGSRHGGVREVKDREKD